MGTYIKGIEARLTSVQSFEKRRSTSSGASLT